MRHSPEYYRRLLEDRLATLEADSEAGREGRSTVELDQSRQGRLSRMDALQGQAMAQAAQRRADRERQRIHAALRRLIQDEYGYCLDCGEEIAEGRLDTDPAATLCIACASARESR